MVGQPHFNCSVFVQREAVFLSLVLYKTGEQGLNVDSHEEEWLRNLADDGCKEVIRFGVKCFYGKKVFTLSRYLNLSIVGFVPMTFCIPKCHRLRSQDILRKVLICLKCITGMVDLFTVLRQPGFQCPATYLKVYC